MLSADVSNLTETDAAADISTSGTLTISDVDSPATFVAQAGTVGSYGTFAIDSRRRLDLHRQLGAQRVRRPAPPTPTPSRSPAPTAPPRSVTINILGTNDAAVLSADVSNLTETDTAADISTSGTLTISDVDSPATFVAQAGTVGSYGTFAIDSAGAWTYTASSAHNEFEDGTTYTDTFAVASADGTTTSVTINILGTNDAAVLSADVSNLTETDTAADISTSGTLTISDVDSPATFVAQAGTAGSYGTFAIDSAGAWTYTASSEHNEFEDGTTYTDTFAVASADGTTTSVTINILGTNDAAVLSADVSNLTETDTAGDISTSGTLTISDVDSPASFVAQAGTAGSYGTFAIDSAGAWTYTASSEHNEFAAGTTYTDTFAVASADGTTTSVTINILGTNDAAVLSADVSNLTETDTAGDISTSGMLTISDVDSPATFVAQAGTIGSYGTFAIDSAGAWTYTASSEHNEFAAGTTYTDTFAVASADGTTTSVTINILGTNDAAVLSADVSNLTETDTAGDISTSGTLTISDVDSPASFVAQAGTAGSYGTFAIDSAGAWTYTASSEHNEFAAGATYTDTFAVASADGTLTSVAINILGTNDTPVANGDAATVAEGGAVTTVNVLANDSDADSALTAASITAFTQGGNGSVVYNNDGTFTYTHNGSETTSDSFTYTIDDGAGGTATTAVSLTVNAPVNQAPVSVDDSGFSTSQDTALTIASSMLLANDSDPNGDPLAITEVSGATNGTVAFDSQTNVITFTPNANYTGTANFSYTVSDGTGGTATASVGLTVTPPTTSLFSSSDTPAALSSLDASEVNLGVRFEASTVGAIWGVKYYKGDGDTGTHVGSLWTSDGTLLASATFTNETSTGWQSVLFSEPVSITAGTTFVASYHSNGHYAYTSNYFTTAHTDGLLTAFAVDNGVFTYSDGNAFPTTSFNATNYWVDVLFSSNGAPNQPPVATDDAATVAEGGAVITVDVLANDSDVNNTLSAANITSFGQGAHGSVVHNGDGTFTYTHDGSETASDSFSYTIDDGAGGTTTATVNVTITPVNDAAVVSADVRDLSETNAAADIPPPARSPSATSTAPPPSWRRPPPSAATAPSPSTPPAPGPTPPARRTTSLPPAPPTPTPSRSPAPTAPSARSPSTSSAPTTPRLSPPTSAI